MHLNRLTSVFASLCSIKKPLVLTTCVLSAVACSTPTQAQAIYVKGFPPEFPFLAVSPALDYERGLYLTHVRQAKRVYEQFFAKPALLQPANKSEACSIPKIVLDRGFATRSHSPKILWDGFCSNGFADGKGRLYVIDHGRTLYECLAQFNSNAPLSAIVYYYKDTLIDNETITFHGLSTIDKRTGISITSTPYNEGFSLSLEYEDKKNQIVYAKTINQGTGYITNTLDYGNYKHVLHDLMASPYPNLSMSYALTLDRSQKKLGFSFIGYKNHSLNTLFTNYSQQVRSISLPENILKHVLNVNDLIENKVSSSIFYATEAQKITQEYKNTHCLSPSDKDICKQVACTDICDLSKTPMTGFQPISSLVDLARQHNRSRRLNFYITNVQLQKNSMKFIEAPERQELINTTHGLRQESLMDEPKRSTTPLIPQESALQ